MVAEIRGGTGGGEPEPPGGELFYYRNYNNDATDLVSCALTPSQPIISITECGFTEQDGYRFKEWNLSPDGSATSYSVGDTAPSSSLFAIWEEIPYDVTISYKGSVIGGMTSSGTKTLETAGTYCEDDITIDYTRAGITVVETLDSHGGTIVNISGDPVTSLQAKTVIPTSQSQIISADSGYDAISEVLVQGDSNLISSNIASGVSIFGVVGTFQGSDNLNNFIEQHSTITSFTDNTISVVGDGAFYNCKSLVSLNLPACTSIGSEAFAYCKKLTTASFSLCTSIGSSAFIHCECLATLSFPACTSMGNFAFAYCSSLTTVSFPACESVGDYAFGYCGKLTTASFPSCTNIKTSAFINCSCLTTLSFPVCTGIGASAFLFCSSLITAYFPMCERIYDNAFLSCIRLTTVSLPSCSYLGSSAFARCYKLLSLYLTGSSVVTLSHSNAFTSTPIAGYRTSTEGVYGSIFVPSSLYNTYITSTNWAYFSSRFVSI